MTCHWHEFWDVMHVVSCYGMTMPDRVGTTHPTRNFKRRQSQNVHDVSTMCPVCRVNSASPYNYAKVRGNQLLKEASHVMIRHHVMHVGSFTVTWHWRSEALSARRKSQATWQNASNLLNTHSKSWARLMKRRCQHVEAAFLWMLLMQHLPTHTNPKYIMVYPHIPQGVFGLLFSPATLHSVLEKPSRCASKVITCRDRPTTGAAVDLWCRTLRTL